jgi:abortive infection bacteriophage resistance protein
MAKEFKTIEELVSLMESRNIETDDMTATAIRRESYYAVINGYKSPFLDVDAMEKSHTDVFQRGTTFNQIYGLFRFDRELRSITFSYLIRAEALLKNSVVYAFCDAYRNHDAYLERSNYTDARSMLVPKTFVGNQTGLFRDNMARLMEVLNRKVAPRKHGRPFVKHYLDTYGDVPLWVLSNDLTFGNIAHFYQLQKRGVQNSACKLVLKATGNGKRLYPQDLLRTFDVLVAYRNLCAHDERLYCAEEDGARFSDMLTCLERALPRSEADDCRGDVETLIAAYTESLGSEIGTLIRRAMGFPVIGENR